MIQFNDLNEQYKQLEASINKNIQKVLKHGRFILGEEVDELERVLAKMVGVRHCISCANGTDALLLSLMVNRVKPGDAIFTSPFTFIATAEVIAMLGATPVFVDIDEQTFNIDTNKLEAAIIAILNENKKQSGKYYKINPKGIIGIDIFGLPADYDVINAIAEKYGLFVIEDAAQSFGASHKGKRAGSLAEFGTTSFFPAKPLGCYGDGGAVFTDNDEMADILLSLRMHGKGKNKYENIRIGVNSRLDTLQAAILLAKIDVFEKELSSRQGIADYYSGQLQDVVQVPFIPEHYKSAWAQYSIVSTSRNHIMQKLKEDGIPSMIYYPKPLHLQEAFTYLGYLRGDCPIAEKISDTIISLPMHPYLQASEQDQIIHSMRSVV